MTKKPIEDRMNDYIKDAGLSAFLKDNSEPTVTRKSKEAQMNEKSKNKNEKTESLEIPPSQAEYVMKIARDIFDSYPLTSQFVFRDLVFKAAVQAMFGKMEW